MPTLFIYNGIRFYFYSNDHEPIHVHVEIAGREGRFMVDPKVVLANNYGLTDKEIRVAYRRIEENREIIIERWAEYFGE